MDTPFIFNLPNEVLREIVSFIPGDEMFWYQTVDGKWKQSIQVLVLMSVSRRFRMIAMEAELWTSKDFDFDSIFPEVMLVYPPDSYQDAQLWLLGMNRVKALLKNDIISSRLEAKIRWTFSAFPLLELAILDIPRFRHTVREITLEMKEVEHLGQLSLCHHITKLILSNSVISVNLGQIPLSCPLLEELEVLLPSNYSGTLNDLSILRSLSIEAAIETENDLPIDLIPLHSTSTLTSLELLSFDKFSPDAKQALSTFSSLAHLSLAPLTNDVCDVLAELSAKLTSFDCGWIHPDDQPPPQVIRMLSSESLSRITTLKLYINPEDWESTEAHQQYSYSVLQAITVALPSLEAFETQMHIAEDECQLFGQCLSLKRLILTLSISSEVDPEERTAQITDCIRKVFRGAEKPLISVSYEFM
jgi:hypothetical protein